MNLVSTGRLALTTAAVATLTLGLAGPAHAEDEPVYGTIFATFQDLTIGALGSPDKPWSLDVYASTSTVNPRLVIDTADLIGIATVSFPASCTTSGTTASCPILPEAQGDHAPVVLGIRAAVGAATGASGQLDVLATGDNVVDESRSVQTATVAATGPDLAVERNPIRTDVPVGTILTAPMTLTNLGDRATKGVRVTMEYSYGLTPTPYANCKYGVREEFRQRGTYAVCDFTRRIDPAGRYALRTGFAAKIGSGAAENESIEYNVEPLTGAGVPDGITFSSRGGRNLPLDLVGAAPAKGMISSLDDIDGSNDSAGQYAAIRSTFDVAAVGATADVTVGGTVPVQVGVRNIGAGAFDNTRSGEPPVRFRFVAPDGTRVDTVPQNCRADVQWDDNGQQLPFDGRTFLCSVPGLYLGAGTSFVRTFELQIAENPYSHGTVTVLGGGGPMNDDDAENDIGYVTLTTLP